MRFFSVVRRAALPLAGAMLFFFSFAAGRASAQTVRPTTIAEGSAAPRAEPTAEQVASLEKLLSGATMVGRFTVTGEDADGGKLTEERYELGEVKRLESGDWLIQSRIRYGDHDVTVPLTLPIRWAGDTPVICVDELPIPGLGTFTARVMIYRDHYAGFWSGADHGGHLFGVIERGKPEAGKEQRH